ncbi:hypothetical protein OQJ18_01255 [Fluoribacter dumoffii]|uniref:hypothetical protein n=1 Tax=Fluoribacter dumoffii TaxID=463 RepID=UPI002244AB1E|nr:hypothetical protein [Fluoribacter dumoffii]MCW8419254.1 hypothetical protein [Fluoribacter dumoffii]MCW8452871.1 hypothetical protein [Fluoribacter dumoffii]MCW8459879.1 hypothetical protein [Fluoribacter dumoffii]MCW8483356.1 hypothetical protein [Fluoribacter dumoffii]
MSISKFKQWLDEVDPYSLQRITLYKCLFVATVEVYVYWLFQPVSFLAFFSPFFLLSLYEAPVLSTYKEKEWLLIFIAIAVMLISVSFYLVYPFRGIFFFFSVFVFAVTYFYVLKYFYALKSLAMLLLATGAVVLSTEPPANLEVAYGFISSTALSMTFALICLRIFPNMYLIIWNKALQKFIQYLEKDIVSAINKTHENHTGEEILHLGMVRNYRRLLPKKYTMQTYRMGVNIRNIQHALDNLYYEAKNELFWYGVKNNLSLLRMNMNTYTPCGGPDSPIEPQTQLQHYIWECLQKAFAHWNKLCLLRQS